MPFSSEILRFAQNDMDNCHPNFETSLAVSALRVKIVTE
jgi:hypothetical protein